MLLLSCQSTKSKYHNVEVKEMNNLVRYAELPISYGFALFIHAKSFTNKEEGDVNNFT